VVVIAVVSHCSNVAWVVVVDYNTVYLRTSM
jgi:hypothetical protein